MNCNRVVSENLMERYLDGRLDEATRDALELHYFECEGCRAMLDAVRTVRPALAGVPAPAAAARPAVEWRWLAVAAAAVLAILVFWPNRQSTIPPVAPVAAVPAPPAQQLAVLQLSEIQPAPYSPALFRGSAPAAPGWEGAMLLYQRREWAAAAAQLSRFTNQPAALHFAGVSYLLAGQIEPALSMLDRVIVLGAQSPFEEEARFYRAQALLLAGRNAEARSELDRVVAIHGDYEAKARALTTKL